MQTADPISSDEESDLSPTARIDAQDEPYVLPIREYLESYGVNVSVNTRQESKSTYHIVVGDAVFVKQIFSRILDPDAKRLAIIIGTYKKHVTLPSGTYSVYKEPTPITTEDVHSIFELFFTGQAPDQDVPDYAQTRTGHEQPNPDAATATHTFSENQTHQERMQSDNMRVKSIIADVFGSDVSTLSDHNTAHTRNRRKRMRVWAWIVTTCIGFIILPVVWYSVSILVAGMAIAQGAQALRLGNVRAVSWHTTVANYWTHQGELVLTVAGFPASLTGMQAALRGQERLLSFMSDTIRAEREASSLTSDASVVAAGLVNQVDATGTGTTAASDISSLRISLNTLQNTLGLAQAQLTMLIKDQTFPFTFTTVTNKGLVAISDLTAIRQSIEDMDKLLSLFLSLSGFKEPRTYLILLQNSMELRPTGGFIGSVAVATFADGRLTNLDMQDVYTYDGQLKGHVDPPIPIKELLAQEHWYLRDSNWDPDFLESGTRAAWFFEKESGTKVDGVIGISTPFIVKLLAATGPIELSDYNDRITEDNFYGKSLYYTQHDFFPGSTQKKDFLGALSRAMLAEITSGGNANTPKLFRAIPGALNGHDLVMMFGNPDLQTLAEHYLWAGRVPGGTGCIGVDPARCRFDPLLMIEANLGVNKVNYFVTRSVERHVAINSDGTSDITVSLTLRNGSGDQSEKMPYQTYIRFILPDQTSVSQVTIDGTELGTRKGTQPPALPYMEYAQNVSGQGVVGVALVVQPSTQKQVKISYKENIPLSFGQSGAVLDLFTQKQPGVSDTPVHTLITYPQDWIAGVEDLRTFGSTRDFIAKDGKLEYNTILTRDDLTRIRFTK